MNLLATILFVFSSSFDVFVVAMAYGFKNIKIKPLSNFVIAFISSLGTFISMELGLALVNIIPNSVVNLIGSIILLILGIYFILDYKKTLKRSASLPKDNNDSNTSSPISVLEKPEIADTNKSGTIEFKESIILSIALALNNVGLGIAASIAGLQIILTTVVTLIFTICIIPLGFLCSKKLVNTWIGKSGNLISGILLIILAALTCFF